MPLLEIRRFILLRIAIVDFLYKVLRVVYLRHLANTNKCLPILIAKTLGGFYNIGFKAIPTVRNKQSGEGENTLWLITYARDRYTIKSYTREL